MLGSVEFTSVAHDDLEICKRGDSPPPRYTPVQPDNAPAVLTFSKLTVSKRGGNKKKLINNVSGSITGGLWAIMGTFFDFPDDI